MLLTNPLLSKSSFFGSLLSKCRHAIIKPSGSNPFDNNFNNVSHISTSTIALKTTEEKLGLPPRPKKPITPFFRYMREMRPKMIAENPKLGTTDVVRELSKKWKNVDVSVKQRLQDEYKRDQEDYIKQRIKYDATLTPEQVADIKEKKQEKLDLKEKRKIRQRVKSLGRPKRPSSAFLLFVQKERESTPQLPEQPYREWFKKCAEKWGRLSDKEKEIYLKEAQKDLEKYKKILVVWEEKMMKLGNLDVVRSSNLIDPPEPKPKRTTKSLNQ